MSKKLNNFLLKKCFELANLCDSCNSAFNVGSLLSDEKGNIITTGFSREIQNMHAEQVAILKANKSNIDLKNLIIYSTLEPCGDYRRESERR